MRPQPIGCGNLLIRLPRAGIRPGFNEAAADRLRKQGVCKGISPRGSGFNEAAADRLRKRHYLVITIPDGAASFNEAAADRLRKRFLRV